MYASVLCIIKLRSIKTCRASTGYVEVLVLAELFVDCKFLRDASLGKVPSWWEVLQLFKTVVHHPPCIPVEYYMLYT